MLYKNKRMMMKNGHNKIVNFSVIKKGIVDITYHRPNIRNLIADDEYIYNNIYDLKNIDT